MLRRTFLKGIGVAVVSAPFLPTLLKRHGVPLTDKLGRSWYLTNPIVMDYPPGEELAECMARMDPKIFQVAKSSQPRDKTSFDDILKEWHG